MVVQRGSEAGWSQGRGFGDLVLADGLEVASTAIITTREALTWACTPLAWGFGQT
jgi:hypothetical protein